MRLKAADAIEEVAGCTPQSLTDEILGSPRPLVLRGLVDGWPMTDAGRRSHAEAMAYLKRFDRSQAPVTVMVAPPEARGRFAYDDDVIGLNSRQEQVPLQVVLDTLLKYAGQADAPGIYVASATIDTWLPGFRAENAIDLGVRDPLASFWIGNRTVASAHQDLPDNLACVVAGRRRATLFPPGQLRNLHVGPLDLTPAGQPISLVDFSAPDLERFPRFAEAMAHAQVAELGAGDALFIPSLWWHHMEALEDFNMLVNYWWRQSPAWMDTPMDALMHAILCVRDLPPTQREAWKEIFRHYVFDADESTASHIPEAARGVLSPLDEARARRLRARLLQRLNR